MVNTKEIFLPAGPLQQIFRQRGNSPVLHSRRYHTHASLSTLYRCTYGFAGRHLQSQTFKISIKIILSIGKIRNNIKQTIFSAKTLYLNKDSPLDFLQIQANIFFRIYMILYNKVMMLNLSLTQLLAMLNKGFNTNIGHFFLYF